MNDSTIYLFGEKKYCDKCQLDKKSAAWTRNVIIQYDESRNLLLVRCPKCGYVWMEGCADGRDPIELSTWLEIEYKEPPGLWYGLDDLVEATQNSIDAFKKMLGIGIIGKRTEGEDDGHINSDHPAEPTTTKE